MKKVASEETVAKWRDAVEAAYNLKMSFEKLYANDPLWRDCNIPECVRSVNKAYDELKAGLMAVEESRK